MKKAGIFCLLLLAITSANAQQKEAKNKLVKKPPPTIVITKFPAPSHSISEKKSPGKHGSKKESVKFTPPVIVKDTVDNH